MKGKTKLRQTVFFEPRLRLRCGKKIALGPGKAELLALIGETASIGKAAKKMQMSYMRAWTLVQEMNECFTEPLVVTVRGGETGGGAQLTKAGGSVLKLYAEMNRRCEQACAAPFKKIQKMLG